VHHTSADQAAGDLEDDGGDIVAAKEVLAILERLRGKLVFGPQSFSEGTETGAIGGEQIGREACVRQAALIRFHASRIPGDDEFARGTLQSVRSGGAPDREGLKVPVLVAIGVGGRAELDLEGDVFGNIAIRIKSTQLAPSDHRSTKSADGRVATEAAWLNGNNLEKEEMKKKKGKKRKKA